MSLSFALPGGRLIEDSRRLFREAGMEIPETDSRELVIKKGSNSFVFAKSFDVPVYVEHGIDMGISGSDVVEERGCDLFIPIELPFGRCRMSVIGPENLKTGIMDMEGFTVATKYPKTTSKFFESAGVAVNVVKLHGAVELGPKVGISDVIVDIVDSGNTIRANGLREIHVLSDVKAVLLVNRISQKTKFEEINNVINRIRSVKSTNISSERLFNDYFKSIH